MADESSSKPTSDAVSPTGKPVMDPNWAKVLAPIVALAGAINIPIVKFSVPWWNSLHQPASVFRPDGPTIAPAMLWPLLVMAAGYTVLVSEGHTAGGIVGPTLLGRLLEASGSHRAGILVLAAFLLLGALLLIFWRQPANRESAS